MTGTRFSLNRLIIAMTCYAAVMAYVALCFSWPKSNDHDLGDLDITMMWIWLAAPALGIVVGFGTGGLLNHRLRGALVGFGLALLIDASSFAFLVLTAR
jgi:hypothetical protein